MSTFAGLLIAIVAVLSHSVHASNWLYLALSGVNPPPDPYEHEGGGVSARSVYSVCDDLVGLNDRQRELCYQHPYAMPSVSYGARDAIIECQWQFKYERWNCSMRRTLNQSHEDVFDTVLDAANRETAFISAVTSAGIVHSITRGCSTGNLTECGCDNNYRGGEAMEGPGNEKWHWGGCSDNVRYGVKFAKQFLDREERERHRETKEALHLMNLHNHEVGRETVERLMHKQCRCHGVSGSCEFKTCWQQLPKFHQVGEQLKGMYDQYAVRVARRAKKRLRRKEKSDRKIPIRSTELVYLQRSPNYCIRNEQLGIFGTRDRECNSTSLGADSCDLLCCGRGYNKRIEERKERCKCKFVWCCYVKCKICEEKVEVHTCK